MVSSVIMDWIKGVLLVLVLLGTEVEGMKKRRCKKKVIKLTAGVPVELTSPEYPNENPVLPCLKRNYVYKSPPETTLTMSCPELDIKSKNDLPYLWNSANKKKCWKAPCAATTNTRRLRIQYVSTRKNIAKKKFIYNCTIVAEPCICGKRIDTKIVGGSDASGKDLPYQARFHRISDGKFICGGSLISKQWVVTAAHCSIKKGRYKVFLGSLYISAPVPLIDRNIQEFTVVKVKTHGSYNSTTNHFDIAVVKLDRPMIYNDYITPICLPYAFVNDSFNDTLLETSGWGDTSYGGVVSNHLQKVTLQVITNVECERAHEAYEGNVFPESICTLTPDKGPCNRDSGGPLAYHSGGSSYLIGVVAAALRCVDGPTLYTRVSHKKILKWVKKNAELDCAKRK